MHCQAEEEEEEETRINDRLTHPFIGHGYRQPKSSLHGTVCSHGLGREMSTPSLWLTASWMDKGLHYLMCRADLSHAVLCRLDWGQVLTGHGKKNFLKTSQHTPAGTCPLRRQVCFAYAVLGRPR